jgi:alkaline phosphatase D
LKYHLFIKLFLIQAIISSPVEANSIKLGLGSCLDQDFPQPIWNSIKQENLNYFIFLGDNVYGDLPSGKLNKMKKAYAHQKKLIPDWLFKKDVNVIWDDHDYGINNGGASYPLKKQAQLMYLDFWNISSGDERRKREGIYTNKFINIDGFMVNLILLDTRYFRSDLDKTIGINPVYKKNLDLNSTILGKKQWAWLEEIINRKADLVIISTSIQLLATSHRFEKWSNFPHEHIRMKKLLKQLNTPVLIISGDRHQGAIYKEDGLFEITSSSLNKVLSPSKFIGRPKEVDNLMIGDMYPGENYGLITIDTEKKDFLIELKDLNGQKVRKLLVPLSTN